MALPLYPLSHFSNLIVNPLPPTTVGSVVVNSGMAQRSRFMTITLNFSNPVDAVQLNVPGTVTLIRTVAPRSAPQGTALQNGVNFGNGEIYLIPTSGLVSSMQLIFDSGSGTSVSPGVDYGSLADGRWQLSIPYINYSSPLNDPYFRRLYGDTNLDGTVDGTDFAAFGNVFGHTVLNSPLDFNNDGTIDGTDFAQFGARFGVTL
jgi:hypothetical protein